MATTPKELESSSSRASHDALSLSALKDGASRAILVSHLHTLYFRFRLFHRSAIFGIPKASIGCHLELPFAQVPSIHAMDASRRMVVVKLDLVNAMTFRDAMHRLDEHIEAIFHHGDQQSMGFLTGMAAHDRL